MSFLVRNFHICFMIMIFLNMAASIVSAKEDTIVDLIEEVEGLYSVGLYAEALPIAQQLVALTEEKYGQEHHEVASRVHRLALVVAKLGDYGMAKSLHERALNIRENVYGSNHPDVATTLNNLGSVVRRLGDYDSAKSLLERALNIRENVCGSEHPDVAESLGSLAHLHYILDDYATAKSLHERSLLIRETVFGPEAPEVANSLNNLGLVYKILGELTIAKIMHERALSIYTKRFGQDSPQVAVVLNNLALLHQELGDYSAAKNLYEKVLPMKEMFYGPNHPSVAISLNNLALVHQELGDYATALSLHRKALYIREKSYGLEHQTVAISLNHVAYVSYCLNDYDEAMSLLNTSLQIAEKSVRFRLISNIYSNMSLVFSAQKLPGPAIFFGKRAVNILQSLRSGLVTLDKELQKSFLETNTQPYKALADLLMSEGRLAEAQAVLAMLKEEEFFSFIRRDAKNDNRTTTVPFSKGEEPWEVRYQEISGHLAAMGTEMAALKEKAKLGLTDADKDRLKDLDKDLRVAQKAFQHFLTELQDGLASAARAEEIGEKNLKDLRAFQGTLRNLGSGTVLLHYLVSDEKLWILLTTTEVQIVRHVAINASDLNLKIGAWRQSLTNPQGDPLPLAREMYELLVAPVAGDLEAAKTTTLMLSLDGMLRYVPFAALHDGQQWLAEQYNLALFTEAAKTKLTDRRSDDLRLSGLGVTKAHGEFAPLPAVKGELYAIQSAIPGETLLDEEFTSDALRMALLLQYPVLHIASHFHFNPGTEERSFLLLGDGTTLSLADIRDQTFDFNGVEILTLSACETAMGGGADGREIEGLGALAQRQGAKGVLATLWPVADESTGQFMGKMYGRLSQGDTTKAEALRSTQLDFIFGRSGLDSDTPVTVERGRPMVLKQEVSEAQNKGSKFAGYSHPYYWAPFILMGNWL
jgi:CHAT domain-containing protein/Tfp pilus assembly protein PilF